MLAFYAKSLPDIKRQPCRKHHISLALPIHSRTASAMHPIPHPQSPPNHGEYVNDTWPNNHLQSAQSIRRPTWSLPHHWSPITSRRSPSPSHDAPTPSSFLPLLWLAFLSSFFFLSFSIYQFFHRMEGIAKIGRQSPLVHLRPLPRLYRSADPVPIVLAGQPPAFIIVPFSVVQHGNAPFWLFHIHCAHHRTIVGVPWHNTDAASRFSHSPDPLSIFVSVLSHRKPMSRPLLQFQFQY